MVMETRAVSLEKDFEQYRQAHVNTPEAKLQWELDAMKIQLQQVEEQKAKALSAKTKYDHAASKENITVL